ncbi:pilus assembly protein TadG [Enterovibrio norvegicus]|uniref:TadE/TadG family type IV pilus assembly protein n=1 Tax=Enterovibrio norvegicus TaxID=188144 RepID=UPI000C85A13D|nr:pilus assembly protein [Enterovibrio norvegicus]MCC4797731.1 pilus assembly protein [Enterovibrio norvegicus]PMI32747.1 pilus assembly protein TadG [Enterovibrio norvegicus]PMI38819.1 pilus assembly protein TadG [Enterovibrio norvegicus]PMN45562.1 pilus assembly protein TadG [Enterovibrio norvegicus]TKF19066.1 pilus assembly protein TadG [Enterovibrio norvegicus]
MKIQQVKKQKGVAAIMFVVLFPTFFALFVLGVEATRYLQTHARFGDAVEMASLAVAANASTQDSENKQLAKNYAQAYLPDGNIDLSKISIIRKSCDDIYGEQCGKPGVYDEEGLVFTQYNVVVKSDFTSWYPEDDFAYGFEQNVTMGTNAVSRKYQGFTIDVAFVADFSGSMKDPWNGQTKYRGVINVIEDITRKLESFNESTEQELDGKRLLNKAAFIGYNLYTSNGSSYFSNVNYNNASLSKKWWTNTPNIAFDSTIANPLTTTRKSLNGRVDGDNSSYFETVDLTDDFSSFRSTINMFIPNHGTASYEGIIAAAKLLEEGENVRKLIIVLSDGEDSTNSRNPDDNRYPGYAALQLYNGGLCSNIIADLEALEVDGRSVEAKIAVIGFDYNIAENPGLQTCAGAENVQSANSYQEIYDNILELISEEVGHLYYRNYE